MNGSTCWSPVKINDEDPAHDHASVCPKGKVAIKVDPFPGGALHAHRGTISPDDFSADGQSHSCSRNYLFALTPSCIPVKMNIVDILPIAAL
jgi:hypothetical protein